MAFLGTAACVPTRPAPCRRGQIWLAVLGCLALAGSGLAAPAALSREYQVKAVFLFNFAQFVEWPAAAFPSADTPLVIGVLGDDPFGDFLDETVRDEKVGGRPLQVRRFASPAQIDLCHILFISQSESARLEQEVAQLKGRSILTVGETDGYSKRGVMIRFLTEKNKIRLRINLEAATAGGLRISSKLLRPAEIVRGGMD